MQDRLNYVKALENIGSSIELLGVKYDKTAQRELRTDDDVKSLKKDWLNIVEEFRVEQNKIKQLKTPVGCDEDVMELNQYYADYVDAIEEKSEKFGVSAMKSGELDSIQKRELEASANIKKWAERTAHKWF